MIENHLKAVHLGKHELKYHFCWSGRPVSRGSAIGSGPGYQGTANPSGFVENLGIIPNAWGWGGQRKVID